MCAGSGMRFLSTRRPGGAGCRSGGARMQRGGSKGRRGREGWQRDGAMQGRATGVGRCESAALAGEGGTTTGCG